MLEEMFPNEFVDVELDGTTTDLNLATIVAARVLPRGEAPELRVLTTASPPECAQVSLYGEDARTVGVSYRSC